MTHREKLRECGKAHSRSSTTKYGAAGADSGSLSTGPLDIRLPVYVGTESPADCWFHIWAVGFAESFVSLQKTGKACTHSQCWIQILGCVLFVITGSVSGVSHVSCSVAMQCSATGSLPIFQVSHTNMTTAAYLTVPASWNMDKGVELVPYASCGPSLCTVR